MSSSSLQGDEWSNYIILNELNNTPSIKWHKYQGRWGQSAQWDGWEGPQYPWLKKGYNKTLQTILKEEEMSIYSVERYSRGEYPRTRIYNIHTL